MILTVWGWSGELRALPRRACPVTCVARRVSRGDHPTDQSDPPGIDGVDAPSQSIGAPTNCKLFEACIDSPISANANACDTMACGSNDAKDAFAKNGERCASEIMKAYLTNRAPGRSCSSREVPSTARGASAVLSWLGLPRVTAISNTERG